MTTKTFQISENDADTLAGMAQGDLSAELRDVLLALSDAARGESSVTIVEKSKQFTPNEAASILRMSRTHLYKLLDSGEIISHRVGRDRRITLADLRDFESRRQADRRELAERFARHNETRSAAIEELADLL